MQRDVDRDAPPQSLLLLLDKIAATMASPLSIRSTAEELSAGRREVGTRLNRLVSSFAALWCPQHELPGVAVEGTQSKLYLADPVLAQLPARLRAGLRSPDMTVLSEAALGVTLARAVEHLDEGRLVAGDTIGYVRTGGGNEVDFGPVPIPGNAGAELSVPLESKWVDDGWRGEAKVLDGKYGNGVMATKSVLDFEHNVWAIPAPLVCLLLG